MRTKLVFALVAVSLISMLTLGGVTYSQAGGLLRQNTFDRLEGLAESKSQALDKLIVGWQDRVALISSRTQLRLSLREHNRSNGRASAAVIERILADAQGSQETVRSLVVRGIDSEIVASVGPLVEPFDPGTAHTDVPAPDDPSGAAIPRLTRVELLETGELRATYYVDLILDGVRLGSLTVELDGREVIDLIENYAGLGETGETMILIPREYGPPRMIHGRFPSTSSPALLVADGRDPFDLAIAGGDSVYSEGATDYRGKPVWVAPRRAERSGWGVIVKFDEAEATAPIVEFRDDLRDTGLALAAFAILLGTLLGIRFARPILALADVANRVREGDLRARAEVVNHDEIGLFARTFNQMADELERQMSLLHEFHKFFDVSLDMLCIAGTDGYFKRVNPAFEKTLGWTEEELLSRPFVDFVHPDDREPTEREVQKLSEGIPTVSFENRYRRADGVYRNLLWTSHPDPQTGMLYAVARDITELKREQIERLTRESRALGGADDHPGGDS